MSTCKVNESKFWEEPIVGIWTDKDGRIHGSIFQMLEPPSKSDSGEYWGVIYDSSPCPMHKGHNFCISVPWQERENEQPNYQAVQDFVYAKKRLTAQSLFKSLERHQLDESA